MNTMRVNPTSIHLHLIRKTALALAHPDRPLMFTLPHLGPFILGPDGQLDAQPVRHATGLSLDMIRALGSTPNCS